MNTKTETLDRREDELHQAARHLTGLEDFGDPGYREGLRVLLEAFDRDLELTDIGWQSKCRGLINCLRARLYAQKGWTETPVVLTAALDRPLIIAGLPRSGTTALHKLLSVDPQFQGLEYWLQQTPMIRPHRETWEANSEYQECVADLERRYARSPDLREVHEFVAGEVESCTPVLLQSFRTCVWSSARVLPTYDSWIETQSAGDTYRYYANVLRLIGAHDRERRWLLKTSYHMVEVDTLLATFPDACVVQTHRDPLKVIPSLCDMVMRFVPSGGECEAEPKVAEGQRMCEFWLRALARMRAVAQKLPSQFFNVDQRDLLADPLGTVRSIYEFFGLTLTSEVTRRMRSWIAKRGPVVPREYKYAVGAWGITPEYICEVFSDYRSQHQFTSEARH